MGRKRGQSSPLSGLDASVTDATTGSERSRDQARATARGASRDSSPARPDLPALV